MPTRPTEHGNGGCLLRLYEVTKRSPYWALRHFPCTFLRTLDLRLFVLSLISCEYNFGYYGYYATTARPLRICYTQSAHYYASYYRPRQIENRRLIRRTYNGLYLGATTIFIEPMQYSWQQIYCEQSFKLNKICRPKCVLFVFCLYLSATTFNVSQGQKWWPLISWKSNIKRATTYDLDRTKHVIHQATLALLDGQDRSLAASL